jgi:hypothetical protein
MITLLFEQGIFSGSVKVQIYSIYGQLITEQTPDQMEDGYLLMYMDLTPGVYQLILTDGTSEIKERFVHE